MDEMRRGMYTGRGPRGYRRSDERIREDVNERLTDDWRVDASDIEVSVDNGLVTLAGRVGSRAQKRRAEDVAESVSGVTDVSNQLRVGPSVPLTTETPEMARVRTAR
jgi:osmotically-inducible protein OsmY